MTHPTVTSEQIDTLLSKSKVISQKIGDKTAVVNVTLPNGFEITEKAACVCAENYNHEKGVQIAMERVKTKLWELEGYLLQQRLYEGW